MSKKRTFRLTVDLVFEADDEFDYDEIEALTAEQLTRQINNAFNVASYNFFGESICNAGLLTPKVGTLAEVK